jgi:hypothetical protein
MCRILTSLALALAAISLPAMGQSLELAVMPGKVIQGHAKWEEECRKCHVPFNKSAQDRLCGDCHKEVAADVRARSGYHGRQKEERECRACHTDHKGRDARIVLLDEQRFDHAKTDFGLRAAHVKVKCSACHLPRVQYRKAPLTCNECHRKDDKHKGGLGPLCADCHSEANWKEAKFDHNKTRYPLRAKHVQVACKDCHPAERYKGVPLDCMGCHKKDDTHKGLYGPKCESCHGERDWKTWTYDHEREAQFALRDKHRSAKCASCHKAPVTRGKLPTTCNGCHRPEDVHKGRLGPKCESCHGERTWKTSSFKHETSRFPLRGKHAPAKCDACHKDNNTFKDKLPETCVGCHKKDDERAKHNGRYGVKCEACHDENVWKPSTFDHRRDTKYPLRPKHDKVKCDDCHRGDLYRDKLQSACIACHEKDDKHKAQLGRKCESCHSEQDWKKTTFDHNRTKFPLLGRHAPAECKACHSGLLYKDVKTTCFACHDKDDTHKRRLGPRCEDCHNARDWKIWDFDHSRTKYPLDGAHPKVACLACHREPVKDKIRLGTACASCHQRDDVHAGRFGSQCERCHVTGAWPTISPNAGFGSSPKPKIN